MRALIALAFVILAACDGGGESTTAPGTPPPTATQTAGETATEPASPTPATVGPTTTPTAPNPSPTATQSTPTTPTTPTPTATAFPPDLPLALGQPQPVPLASAPTADTRAYVYAIESGEIREVRAYGGFAWRPGTTEALVGLRDRLALYDAESHTLRELPEHAGTRLGTWNAQGTAFWAPRGDQSNQTAIVDFSNRRVLRFGGVGPVWHAAWSPDGRRLATETQDGRAVVIRVGALSWTELQVPVASGEVVTGVEWLDDTHLAVTAYSMSGIRLRIARLDDSTVSVLAVRHLGTLPFGFSPDHRHLAVRERTMLVLMDARTLVETERIPSGLPRWQPWVWSRDGASIAVQVDRSVRLFNLGEQRAFPPIDEAVIVSWLPADRSVVAWQRPCADDEVFFAMDRATGDVIELPGEFGSAVLLAERFGRQIASVAPDGRAVLLPGRIINDDGTVLEISRELAQAGGGGMVDGWSTDGRFAAFNNGNLGKDDGLCYDTAPTPLDDTWEP